MLSMTDTRLINDLVSVWGKEGIGTVKVQMLRIFGKEITANHWITLGSVIGQRATYSNGSKNKLIFSHENHN